MKTKWKKRLVVLYSIVAGLGPVATGLALMFAPAFALQRMGVEVSPGEALIWHRYLGAFVMAVAFSFHIGLIVLWRTGRWERLRFAWEFMAVVDVFIGAFVLLMVLDGQLENVWLKVPLSDFTGALIQVTVLVAGWFPKSGAR